MADIDYVRQYFSDHAREWLAGAYGTEGPSGKYPIGLHRVRLTLEAIVNRIEEVHRSIIDLGCGGGDLCIHASQLGMSATGIDIAEGMISSANEKKGALPEEIQRRLAFISGNVLDNNLTSENYDAVTALGLIEYLPEDGALFAEAHRLLKPGGVFVVSCRNRLFNISSLNDYTIREIEEDSAQSLLSNLATLPLDDIALKSLEDFVRRLKESLPKLEEAIQADRKDSEEGNGIKKRVAPFEQKRRQHTTDQLWQSAKEAGFVESAFIGVHPHPFPPRLEPLAPRFYNQVASVFEVFENSPVSLVWSSAFLGVFAKPK